MTKKIILLTVLATLVLVGCGAAAAVPYKSESQADESNAPRMYAAGGAPEAAMPTPALNDNAVKYEGDNGAAQDRMIIKNADLTIVVSDPEAKMTAITVLAKRYGGHVVSASLYQTYTASGEKAPEASISIRVLADQLETALAEIKADVVEVRSETQSSQDVTADYVDMESRLSALEAAATKLEQIMQNATDTQDVLDVFSQLQYYREQIEIVKGQMKYYRDASSTSLINVTIIAEKTVQPIKIGPWTPKGAVNDAIETLIKFLRGFVDFLIWLVMLILPVLIVIFGPIALVVWLIVVLVRRKKAKKAKQA